MNSITGYLSIWKGMVCVLPLTALRGEWHGSTYNQQEVIVGTYANKPVTFNVIHYAVGTEYD